MCLAAPIVSHECCSRSCTPAEPLLCMLQLTKAGSMVQDEAMMMHEMNQTPQAMMQQMNVYRTRTYDAHCMLCLLVGSLMTEQRWQQQLWFVYCGHKLPWECRTLETTAFDARHAAAAFGSGGKRESSECAETFLPAEPKWLRCQHHPGMQRQH